MCTIEERKALPYGKKMRIALKFLKTYGLYKYWVKYLASSTHTKRSSYDPKIHWADKEDIVDIFGQTKFTAFLSENNITIKNNADYPLFVYEVFETYLAEYYPIYIDSSRPFQLNHLPIIISKKMKNGKDIKFTMT